MGTKKIDAVETATNDSGTIMLQANRKLTEAQNQRRELHKIYKAEEKVPMYLSPMYAPYFGKVMRVMINGISIFFKVDGSMQSIPKTFADVVVERRRAVDDILTRQSRLANIAQNTESSPGELNLF